MGSISISEWPHRHACRGVLRLATTLVDILRTNLATRSRPAVAGESNDPHGRRVALRRTQEPRCTTHNGASGACCRSSSFLAGRSFQPTLPVPRETRSFQKGEMIISSFWNGPPFVRRGGRGAKARRGLVGNPSVVPTSIGDPLSNPLTPTEAGTPNAWRAIPMPTPTAARDIRRA
jgi:hypothetical protein